MSTEEADAHVQAFRERITKLTERELVTRLKAVGLMLAVDEEFGRRLAPELIAESNAKLYQMSGVSSTEELMDILREELSRRSAAKASVV